jgi:hypothetical protein
MVASETPGEFVKPHVRDACEVGCRMPDIDPSAAVALKQRDPKSSFSLASSGVDLSLPRGYPASDPPDIRTPSLILWAIELFSAYAFAIPRPHGSLLDTDGHRGHSDYFRSLRICAPSFLRRMAFSVMMGTGETAMATTNKNIFAKKNASQPEDVGTRFALDAAARFTQQLGPRRGALKTRRMPRTRP